MSYNNQLLSFSQSYNEARAEADKKISKLRANIGNMYSQSYIISETEKINKELNSKFIAKAEDLLNTVSKERLKAAKNVNYLKYPSLKSNPGSFEIAYSNVINFLSSTKNGSDILKEAEQAIEMGRNEYAFILFDEIAKQNEKSRGLNPEIANLFSQTEKIKERYFQENGIKYNEALIESSELTANEWDAKNILEDIKSGFAAVYPYRIFDQVSDNMKVDMSIAFENIKNVSKKIIYSRAMKSGQFQTL